MKNKKNIKSRILKISLALVFLFVSLYFYIPKSIKIIEGTKRYVNIVFPFKLDISDETLNVCNISLCNEEENHDYLIEGKSQGSVSVKAVIGFIPIKKVTVDVLPNTKLIPIGKTCGIRIFEDGVLVLKQGNIIGITGVKESPSKDLILEGDVIKSINGEIVENKSDLTTIVNNSKSKEVDIVLERDGQKINVKVKPEKEAISGEYKLGLWVRDSTQGIGTMTYYNPIRDTIGVLGHAIVDVDTGKIFDVRKGKLLKTDLTYVKKGTSGNPGEIIGMIYDGAENEYGNIIKNTTSGIIANINENIKSKINLKDAMPIALSSEVRLGKAYILSDVVSNKVNYYEIEIEEINKYGYGNSKGMTIKIIDNNLLNATGGIVQGMSGSPIIQEGKIIGAVTHVFVKDPSKGFGIFIESMLEEEV